jgi:glycogen debranching enzyme-like protein
LTVVCIMGAGRLLSSFVLLKVSVSVVSPAAYVISDGRGDVDSSVEQGLFYRDVRHLSQFRLKIERSRPGLMTSFPSRGTGARRARRLVKEYPGVVERDRARAERRRQRVNEAFTKRRAALRVVTNKEGERRRNAGSFPELRP